MKIGTITKLVRHPVKSFTGESVASTNVVNYGMYGDRSHAFIDLTNNQKHLTITQYPDMATYKARFTEEESPKKLPSVEIVTKDGKIYDWQDPCLLQELEANTNRKLTAVQYAPDFVPFPAIEEDHLLLISEQSLEQLENSIGERVDERRFRGNIVYQMEALDITEEELIGKKIKIGSEVIIQINKFCERCMIITVDPETGEKKPSILKKIVKENNNHFGLYAAVLHTGKINVGDFLQLIDE
ncbi:MOSC domain-containing protein [Niallia nealsonii]|uniref:MOSC domain-containing protein n=1 Tax=Niallia nealsonii TaxID=115979 RepID=A0A2N0Z1B1_9BACI|nr:MOSC domain-containing protein [Niallia nealsonii]PKG23289.1 MOSC domain-containing protein [Niallia nealsonii]